MTSADAGDYDIIVTVSDSAGIYTTSTVYVFTITMTYPVIKDDTPPELDPYNWEVATEIEEGSPVPRITEISNTGLITI